MTEPIVPGYTVAEPRPGATLIELRVVIPGQPVTLARFTREDMGAMYADIEQAEDLTLEPHLSGRAGGPIRIPWARRDWTITVKGVEQVETSYEPAAALWFAHDVGGDITAHASRAGAMARLNAYGTEHGLTTNRWWDDPADPGRMVGDSGYLRPVEVSP